MEIFFCFSQILKYCNKSDFLWCTDCIRNYRDLKWNTSWHNFLINIFIHSLFISSRNVKKESVSTSLTYKYPIYEMSPWTCQLNFPDFIDKVFPDFILHFRYNFEIRWFMWLYTKVSNHISSWNAKFKRI